MQLFLNMDPRAHDAYANTVADEVTAAECATVLPANVTTEGEEDKENETQKNNNCVTIKQDHASSSSDQSSPSSEIRNHDHSNDLLCQFCNSTPCLLEQGLYEELVLAYELGLDPADMSSLATNKQVRFRLYRYAINWIHDYLGKGNRRQLPQCVQTEIRDLAPESSGIYVGFKKRRVNDGSNSQEGH